MFLLNGQPLQLDIPFEIDGTNYPANWLRLTSIEEKNAVGITEVTDTTVTYDDRFYWGVDIPMDLDVLKTRWSAQVKDTANKLLTQTDWMVIRKVERSVDIPVDTVTYRAAVLAECTSLVAAITSCADVPSLATIVTTQNWPIENPVQQG
jgi:hypothetical protein